jgi:DNA-binding GntR family transcriptional regulator
MQEEPGAEQEWRRTGLAIRRKPPTLAHHVAEELRAAIISGELPPGTVLTLNDLAERFDVSIMPVREALKRLQYEGLIEQERQKEARVTTLSLTDLEDVYHARIAMETVAVRRAAERMQDTDYAHLSAVLDDYERAYETGDEMRGRQAHHDFHFGIYRLGASPWMLELIGILWQHSERYRRQALSLRGTPLRRREEHQQILEACRRHEADLAATLMEAHLMQTAQLLIRSMTQSLESSP